MMQIKNENDALTETDAFGSRAMVAAWEKFDHEEDDEEDEGNVLEQRTSLSVQVLEFDPWVISRARERPRGENESFSILDSTTPWTIAAGACFKDEIVTDLPCVESKWFCTVKGTVYDLKLFEDGFVVSVSCFSSVGLC